ncbi:MAG: DUF5668 domain-containing protein [Ignavibacteriaceae bacterium]
MKNKHIFWGLFFISIGIFILVNNFTSYNFYFEEIWKVWPVVLILLGISMLISQAFIKSILVGLTAVVLAFAIFSTFKTGCGVIEYDDNEITIDSKYEKRNFSESYDEQIKSASLNFDAGAGSFSIRESSGNLFEAETEGIGNFLLNRSSSGNEAIIDFMMRKKRFSFHDGRFKNKVIMKLNLNPLWNINLNAGAASINLDLSDYKIENLNIDMGAASLKVMLGIPEKEMHLELDAGVSSIDIVIPESVGCEITADISLSSKNFKGFSEVKDNLYRTENFNNSDKKIYMDLSTGVSSITVKRSSGW